jgi:hypothetical protein
MRRSLRNSSVALACASGLLAILAPSASATWGNKCSYGEGHHCYAIAEWEMDGNGYGSGEEVNGVVASMYTTAMVVPLFEQGDFVNNETWMIGPGGGWEETGQAAGHNYYTEEGHNINDDSLHYFYAWEIGPEKRYEQYITPWTVEGYEWHGYSVEDPERNGRWCVKFYTATEACEGTFATYGTTVQVGMEAADEQQPENAGKDESLTEFTNGNWYPWGSATRHLTEAYGGANESSYICIVQNGSDPGNVQWGAPKSKQPC